MRKKQGLSLASLLGVTKKTVSDKTINDLKDSIALAQRETETAEACDDFAPNELSGHKQTYHYKAVDCWVDWRYGGHYGKTLADIGVEPGCVLTLVPEPDADSGDAVAVYFGQIKIGGMHPTRMAAMVNSWEKSNLPVFAAVQHLGIEHKLLVEVAFYGRPRRSQET